MKDKKKLELIEVSRDNLQRTIHWVGIADIKAQILFSVDIAVLGFIVTKMDTTIGVLENLFQQSLLLKFYALLALLGISLICLVSAMVSFVQAINPKRAPRNEKKSLFFYQSISQLAYSEFATKMSSIKLKEVIAELSDQTFNISIVVTRKFDQISLGIRLLFIGILFSVLLYIAENLLIQLSIL